MSDYLLSHGAGDMGFDLEDERLINELLGDYDDQPEPMDWEDNPTVGPVGPALSFPKEEGAALPDSTTDGFEPDHGDFSVPSERGGEEEVVTSTTDAPSRDLGEEEISDYQENQFETPEYHLDPLQGPSEEAEITPEPAVAEIHPAAVIDLPTVNPVDSLSIAFNQIGVWAPTMEEERVRQLEAEAAGTLMALAENPIQATPAGASKGKQRRENRKRKLALEKEEREHLHQKKMQKQRESRRKQKELARKGRMLEIQESLMPVAEDLSVARANIGCPACKATLWFSLGLSKGMNQGSEEVKREG